MTVGMVIFLILIIVSISIFVSSGDDSDETVDVSEPVITQAEKTTLTTMDNDGLMVHNLTYFVQDERLHFDMWMGYPNPELLGGFSLNKLKKNDPPVFGNLIIAYTNA